MSAKNMDKHNRWRSRQVAFRLSPEEADLLDTEVVVQGNPRVFKALRNQMVEILTQLHRIEAGAAPDAELVEVIHFIAKIMEGMKEDTDGR